MAMQPVSNGNAYSNCNNNSIEHESSSSSAAEKVEQIDLPELDIYKCPITHQYFKDPVITKCSHTFERTAWNQYLEKYDDKDPKSKVYCPLHHDLISRKVIANIAMKQSVEHLRFSESYPDDFKAMKGEDQISLFVRMAVKDKTDLQTNNFLLQRQIEATNKEVSVLKEIVQQLKIQLASEKEKLVEKEVEVKKKEAEVKEKELEVKEKEGIIIKKEIEIETKNEAIKIQQSFLEKQKKEIKEKEERSQYWQGKYDARSERIARLREEREEARREKEETAAANAAMQARISRLESENLVQRFVREVRETFWRKI